MDGRAACPARGSASSEMGPGDRLRRPSHGARRAAPRSAHGTPFRFAACTFEINKRRKTASALPPPLSPFWRRSKETSASHSDPWTAPLWLCRARSKARPVLSGCFSSFPFFFCFFFLFLAASLLQPFRPISRNTMRASHGCEGVNAERRAERDEVVLLKKF